MIFRSPYFTKVWMIQELVMAKQCVHGSWTWLPPTGAYRINLSTRGQRGDGRIPDSASITGGSETKFQVFPENADTETSAQQRNSPVKIRVVYRPRWTLLDMVRKS
jgi:hypothetical protein